MAFLSLFFDYKRLIEKGREKQSSFFGIAREIATINFWSLLPLAYLFSLNIYIKLP